MQWIAIMSIDLIINRLLTFFNPFLANEVFWLAFAFALWLEVEAMMWLKEKKFLCFFSSPRP